MNELAAVASNAAIELDNLLLGRQSTLEAVKTLARMLNELVATNSGPGMPVGLVDPGTAVVMSHALAVSPDGPHPASMDQLIAYAQKITRTLEVSSTPDEDEIREESRYNEVARVRSFCVALSKAAAADHDFLDDDDAHPFRM